MRTVAALYVDPRGPYPAMPGVECWDETRDARKYAGPHPVVAHPPCGPWGRLKAFCTRQDPALGLLAVEQVRKWGGGLEHPAHSGLWKYFGLPHPGEMADAFGGWTLAVEQVDFGHKCRKLTWLYIVGAPPGSIRVDLPKLEPTHTIAKRPWRPGTTATSPRTQLPECTELERRLSPPAFAEFLVGIARYCNAAAKAA